MSSTSLVVLSKNTFLHLSDESEHRMLRKAQSSPDVDLTDLALCSPIKRQRMSLASLSTQDSVAFGAWETMESKSSWSCLSEIEEISEDLQMSNSYPEEETTIMLRHIPCKYSQEHLMQEVLEFTSNFDYFYLPPARTAKIEKNLGYAFVNFKSSYEAQQFMDQFQGYQFKMFPNSLKRATVGFADLQGVEANMESYYQSKIGMSKVYRAKFAPWVSQNKF